MPLLSAAERREIVGAQAVLIDRICAWCKKVMGQKQAGEPGDTHGICPDCGAKFEADAQATRLRMKTAAV